MMDLLRLLCIRKLLMVRDAVGNVQRIRLHSNEVLDIRKNGSDNAVVVGNVGELWIEQFSHLSASSRCVVRL
jgi:hypothetical protein